MGDDGAEMFPRDRGVGDSRLMGPVSGLLWLTAGIAAAICQVLPEMPGRAPVVAWTLIFVVVLYGVACVRGWIAWEKATLCHHACAVVAFQPLIALGLWVSGGVDSYLGPILVLPTLYVAYFFPPRLAWPLRSSRSRQLSACDHSRRNCHPACWHRRERERFEGMHHVVARTVTAPPSWRLLGDT